MAAPVLRPTLPRRLGASGWRAASDRPGRKTWHLSGRAHNLPYSYLTYGYANVAGRARQAPRSPNLPVQTDRAGNEAARHHHERDAGQDDRARADSEGREAFAEQDSTQNKGDDRVDVRVGRPERDRRVLHAPHVRAVSA